MENMNFTKQQGTADIWTEVRCTYNNEEGFWCVDAYMTEDDDEQGQVVAVIDEKTGNVYYINAMARCSKMAQEVINDKISEIRKDTNTSKMYCVTYVGLSDSEYDANGHSEVALCATLEEGKAKLKAWRDSEIENLKDEGREYEILTDEDDEVRISWCGHGEQIRIEIHEVELNSLTAEDKE